MYCCYYSINQITKLWHKYIYIYKRLCYSCRCLPHPASHPFLFSHSPCCRCLRSISTCMFSLQVLLGLPLFLLLSGTQSSILIGHRCAGILWTWPYHMSLFILIVSMISFFLCDLLISSFRTFYPWHTTRTPPEVHVHGFQSFFISFVYFPCF